MFCKVLIINYLLIIRFLKRKSLYILSVGFTQTKIAIIEKNPIKNDDFKKIFVLLFIIFLWIKIIDLFLRPR